MNQKRQLHRIFVDYYSRKFGFARINLVDYGYRIFSDNNTSFLFFQSVCYWCLYWRRVCDRDCVPYNFNSVELNCQAVFYEHFELF